jgi:outer membrane protein
LFSCIYLKIRSDVALEQRDSTLAQLQEEIRNTVIADLESVRANLRAVEAAFRATENARLQLDAARTQFRLGRGGITQFQLLNQEDQLVQAQNAELNAEIEFLNAIALLDQTVGITLDNWAGQVNIPLELSEIVEAVPHAEPVNLE